MLCEHSVLVRDRGDAHRASRARFRARPRGVGETSGCAAAAPAVPEPQPAARQATLAPRARPRGCRACSSARTCAGALPLFAMHAERARLRDRRAAARRSSYALALDAARTQSRPRSTGDEAALAGLRTYLAQPWSDVRNHERSNTIELVAILRGLTPERAPEVGRRAGRVRVSARSKCRSIRPSRSTTIKLLAQAHGATA